jgi:hypothetical protein
MRINLLFCESAGYRQESQLSFAAVIRLNISVINEKIAKTLIRFTDSVVNRHSIKAG